ncbi:hypothetical protein D3C81_1965430 [compost metagenome]
MMLPGYGLPLPMQRWVWTALSNCRLKLSTQALSSPTWTPLMRRPLMSLKLNRRWLASGWALMMNDVLSPLSSQDRAAMVVVTVTSLSPGKSKFMVATCTPRAMADTPMSVA